MSMLEEMITARMNWIEPERREAFLTIPCDIVSTEGIYVRD